MLCENVFLHAIKSVKNAVPLISYKSIIVMGTIKIMTNQISRCSVYNIMRLPMRLAENLRLPVLYSVIVSTISVLITFVKTVNNPFVLAQSKSAPVHQNAPKNCVTKDAVQLLPENATQNNNSHHNSICHSYNRASLIGLSLSSAMASATIGWGCVSEAAHEAA